MRSGWCNELIPLLRSVQLCWTGWDTFLSLSGEGGTKCRSWTDLKIIFYPPSSFGNSLLRKIEEISTLKLKKMRCIVDKQGIV
jgi:hypothetical protein